MYTFNKCYECLDYKYLSECKECLEDVCTECYNKHIYYHNLNKTNIYKELDELLVANKTEEEIINHPLSNKSYEDIISDFLKDNYQSYDKFKVNIFKDRYQFMKFKEGAVVIDNNRKTVVGYIEDYIFNYLILYNIYEGKWELFLENDYNDFMINEFNKKIKMIDFSYLPTDISLVIDYRGNLVECWNGSGIMESELNIERFKESLSIK